MIDAETGETRPVSAVSYSVDPRLGNEEVEVRNDTFAEPNRTPESKSDVDVRNEKSVSGPVLTPTKKDSQKDSETRWTAGISVVKRAIHMIDRYMSDTSIDKHLRAKVLKLAFDALAARLDDQADKLGVPEDELWGDWDENCLVI